MGVAHSRHYQRLNAGNIFGYQCYICQVPTAATIEHIHPRSRGGLSGFDNIRIACPWCNTRKGAKPLEQFIAEGGHLIEAPELPATVEQLISQFGWDGVEPTDGSELAISTGSNNAKLVLQALDAIAPDERRRVACVFRPSKHEAWLHRVLGASDDPEVVFAAWNFLVRHYTPRVATAF